MTAAAALLAAVGLTVLGAPEATADAPATGERYIVQVQSTPNDSTQAAITADATDTVEEVGGEVEAAMSAAIDAIVVTLPSAGAADELRRDPNVTAVTLDQRVSIDVTQTNPPSWGLDRIDQETSTLDSRYYSAAAGTGVRIYIVDTGVRSTHQDFGGRVASGYNATGLSGGTEDCNGHGTHVAGTAAGTDYGVAKGATIVPVRVLGCGGSGSISGVILGLDWIAANNPPGTRAVVNMSLGTTLGDDPLDTAVSNLVALGIPVVVAAGNSNVSACTPSPARAPTAITVAATTTADARASYSNYGSCVDLFAPGSSIVSDTQTSDTSTGTKSGTSMASPHVAGVVAQYLQRNPSFTPAQVASAVVANSTTGVVTDVQGSTNVLLRALHTVADAPTGVSVVMPANQATVSWTAPSYDGGQLTGYAVYLTTDDGATYTTLSADTASTSTSYLTSTLAAGQLYRFAVASVNPDGTGAKSSLSTSVTPDPAAPINDTATVVEGGSVLIDVLLNDPIGSTLQGVSTQPSFGTATIESGRIRYAVVAGSPGSTSFSYRITGSATPATVNVTVTALPAPASGSGSDSGSGSAPAPAVVPVAPPSPRTPTTTEPIPASAPAPNPPAATESSGLQRAPEVDGVNRPARGAATAAAAPRVSIADDTPIDLIVRGLPGSRATFKVRINGVFIALGSARVDSHGAAEVPTFVLGSPGEYLVKVTAGGKVRFVRLVVTK